MQFREMAQGRSKDLGARLPAVVALDEDDAEADEAMKKGAAAKFGSDNITLSIDGKESRIHVDQLALRKPKVNRKDEEFEFSGPDVSLRGSFAPTFHNDWQELVEEGVNVPIVAKSDRREPGESHVKLPGQICVFSKGSWGWPNNVRRYPSKHTWTTLERPFP